MASNVADDCETNNIGKSRKRLLELPTLGSDIANPKRFNAISYEASSSADKGSSLSKVGDRGYFPHATGNSVGIMEGGDVDSWASDDKYSLKMTIPAYAAGCIIGKNGSTIVEIQKDTHSTIKLSKANEFYPNTKERVVLIVGSSCALETCAKFIQSKIREAVALFGPKLIGEQPPPEERAKLAKVLIPNTTVGLVIGRSGVSVKRIMAETRAKLIVSQKPEEHSPTQERCVTISAERPENLDSALERVVGKICADPQSGSCPNLVYDTTDSPVHHVANIDPGMPSSSFTQPLLQSVLASRRNRPLPYSLPLRGLSLPRQLSGLSRYDLPPSLPYTALSSNAVDSIQQLVARQRHTSFGHIDLPYSSPSKPLFNLLLESVHHQRILQPITMPTSSLNPTDMPPEPYPLGLASARITQDQLARLATLPRQRNNLLGFPTDRYSLAQQRATLDSPLQNFPSSKEIHRDEEVVHKNLSYSNEEALDFHSAIDDNSLRSASCEMEIPEIIVGAIIGIGGKTLIEIQSVTGTKIQISKKGDFVEGTTNRLLTVTGDSAAVGLAQELLRRRLILTEDMRLQQGKVTL